MVEAGWTALNGLATTFQIIKEGTSNAVIEKKDNITVHATGTVVETNKKFWSTKDPG